jgi:heterogeneous nuclear ribonucleoprotein F/H/epithelial splicing regulatory protein 1/2
MSGRPRGFGFVTFTDSRDADDAVKEMDGREVDGRRLTVNIAKARAPLGSGGYGGGGGSRGSRASSDCLEMRGIPFQATEGDIKRFFEEAGVSPTRIHRKVNGGEAYVEFANEYDAGQALTRNKAHIGQRYIDLFPVSYSKMADIVGLPSRRSSYGGRGGWGTY